MAITTATETDLFLSTNGAPNALYQNNGNETFTDIASTAGLQSVGTGKGAAAHDYDGDGDLDVYVAYYGAANVTVNDGAGTFVDVAASEGVDDGTKNISPSGWTTTRRGFGSLCRKRQRAE